MTPGGHFMNQTFFLLPIQKKYPTRESGLKNGGATGPGDTTITTNGYPYFSVVTLDSSIFQDSFGKFGKENE